MEIQRIEQEERDLLGLREGEELLGIHQSQEIENEQPIFLGKRTEIFDTEIHQSEVDFNTFKKFFNFLNCEKCIENIDRIEEMGNRRDLTVFRKLADEIFN